MPIDPVNTLKRWFDTYSRSFLSGDPSADGAHSLKIAHTRRVCEIIVHLGKTMGLSARQLGLAEAIGLFHDLGRFEQFRRFGTFNDRLSVNHAALSVDILETTGILNDLPMADRSIIMDAVRFHNAPSLPGNKPEENTFFMRLIRDADKLDIWKVFADYCRMGKRPEPAIVQHLSDLPICSPAIIKAILEKRMANFKEMKSINDFKLLQLSWVFDLQFPESLALAATQGNLQVIAQSLPADASVQQAISVVLAQLSSSGSSPHPQDHKE
ncbi:HD domain protein [Desulfosarcina cetonica]|uniref:HD domain-containing protein n=1 Tax=Desulfosarcina cetonica TaxID=90730 RepID=UPI0006CF2E02|nr:HD domain-containing protein [Desulfosarcina cetonica]VTR65182.1 HD domain protein [Desulfosarcina cetonica]